MKVVSDCSRNECVHVNDLALTARHMKRHENVLPAVRQSRSNEIREKVDVKERIKCSVRRDQRCRNFRHLQRQIAVIGYAIRPQTGQHAFNRACGRDRHLRHCVPCSRARRVNLQSPETASSCWHRPSYEYSSSICQDSYY